MAVFATLKRLTNGSERVAQKKRGRANLARTEHRRALAQSRNRKQIQQARIEQYAALRRARRQRMTLLIAIPLALAVAAGGVLYWITRPDPPKNYTLASPQVSNKSGDRTITETAESYRIRYLLESFGAGEPKVFDYTLTVRRPFDQDQDYKDGGALVFRQIQNFGVGALYQQVNPVPEVVRASPAIAETDTRFSAIIDDLVADGIYLPKERRKVLDSECVVYRTGSAVGAREFTKAKPTNYADICIDARGFVLEELSVQDGKVFARRTAVELELTPADLSALAIPTDATVSPTTEFSEIPTNVKPDDNYHAIALPNGYSLKGRYKVVEGTDQPEPKTTYSDVYVKGLSTIIVRQGLETEEAKIEFDTAETRPVPAMLDARYFRVATGSVLIGHPTAGWYVRIFATEPWITLAQVGATLAPS